MIIKKIYDGLRMDERLNEESCQRIDELIQYFQNTLPNEEYMLLDELMTLQSISSARLFPKYFLYGVRAGFQLSKELAEEIDDIEDLQ